MFTFHASDLMEKNIALKTANKMGFLHPTNVLLKDIKSYYLYDKKTF